MAHQLPGEVFDTCEGAIYCLFQWFYNVTNGLGPTGLLLAFVVSLFMATSNKFGVTRAYGFGAVVGLLGALYLATMDLMPWWVASLFILNGALGFASLILNER